MPNRVLLIVLDGWGIAPSWGGNAISQAPVNFYNRLLREFPNTAIEASGKSVGLPGHEAGNSEVGHLTIGAGRVIPQDILIINQAIQDRSLFTNKVLVEAVDRTKTGSCHLHLMGLMSDGGVHSHINHLIALLALSYQRGAKRVSIHAFTDGRDTEQMSAQVYLSKVEAAIGKLGVGKIATIAGRWYAMDRDRHFERTQKAYDAMVLGKGEVAQTPLSAVAAAYQQNLTDQFIPPTIIRSENSVPDFISDGDSVIFFNFRADRSRQMTQAFLQKDFRGFKRKKTLNNLYFITLVPYGSEKETKVNPLTAFNPPQIKNTLAELLSRANLPQIHIAETEKYAHITYFLNGAAEPPFPLEERVIIPSVKVDSFDKAPQMSARKVGQVTQKAIQNEKFPFIVVNFANADMVGHSGNLQATALGCETIDQELKILIEEARRHNFFTIVTADHGNAEQLINPKTYQVDPEHAPNPVPFILIPPQYETQRFSLAAKGGLADVAPTVLELLGVPRSPEMTGESLLIKHNVAQQP